MGTGRGILLRFFGTPISITPLLVIVRAATAALMTLALSYPVHAQFWGDSWGGRQQQRQQPSNPFGGFWDNRQWESPRYPRERRQREREPEREQAPDYSRAPAATPRKEATIKVVVMGDANADWLAYGLEDAFSEKPETGIVRKHRTEAGLIRYDQRREIEWPQVAREIIAADKPKFIVMMIGNNDRQTIREKVPAVVVRPAPGAPKTAAQPAQPGAPAAPTPPAVPVDPEQQPPEHPATAELPANMTPEQARQANYGPWEFHTEKWELAYIKRIDATIAALKSAGVPVIWVGLPSQRGPKTTADSSYLNELYRSRAEKAGIVYVDIWDGFVDEQGQFAAQGPDYQGQTRRLRTPDGVHFTKYGARKLAHYVEREIERSLIGNKVPVALPLPVDQGPQSAKGKSGSSVQQPLAGPVLPLTDAKGGSEELLGGPKEIRPAVVDPVAARTLIRGETVSVPTGRSDDFTWPRKDITIELAAPALATKKK